jgi:hypothetical protein
MQNMNPFANIVGGANSLVSGLSSMFAPNPANSAMPYLNQVPGMLQSTLGPYNQFGQFAGGQLQNQIGQLLNNPTALMKMLGGGFQQSPGYQFSVDQATNAANRAAAAGGMAGSPAEQQALAGAVTGLANQDYQNYLNSIMGLYGQGLGAAQNMFGTGAGAANQIAQGLQTNLGNQANLAYTGQQNQNMMQAGGAGQIAGALGAIPGIGALLKHRL